ncbi:SDR family NAD(P)-dependent oxidoreductase [Amorphus orientalis]|uniref:3-oxoacyl-[acyl-carrier protein] reductase n=1 Tax=Amorphus orientalis TaxID=649198 RepID=A0AAE4AQX9_9HYPH|nr:SDR family NAD(P)-dependent oxidoreductase [Amorphus orientalis]MDQ0314576.1 3-oxoacyl-[acyl-carrier protein] reductase [Amorphus orientalis]
MTKLALVTGAGGGIGSAVSRRLASDGFRVLATDMSLQAAEKIAAELTGGPHPSMALDVGDEAAVADVFRRAEAEYGAISVVVAAAGLLILDESGARRPIVETSTEEWSRTQHVNSTGTFFLVREFLRLRQTTRLDDARFIAFGSVAAQLGGYRSSSAYITSKSAILGLVKAAAREGAPFGVAVNAVAPGLIDAPMLRMSLDPSGDAEVAKAIPLGRIGTPDDVAGAVSFLAGPDSAYMTGAVLDVNGGYRMQ